MRKEKALLALLNGLVKLLGEEAGRNPDFANRLDALMSPLQGAKSPHRHGTKPEQLPLPDIYAEYSSRGEAEFRLWLPDQPIQVLHALIRHHDLDATRRSSKWKEPEKLSAYIADQLRSRMSRGSAFLPGVQRSENPSKE